MPCEPDFYNKGADVFSFPILSPRNAVTRTGLGAIDQLTLVAHYNEHWCEHKASVTVYVGEDEWLDVGAWVYRNFDTISGVSFLPRDNGSYRQAPYEEISEDTYEVLSKAMPTLDFSEYMEIDDNTTSSQELACTAGVCEL